MTDYWKYVKPDPRGLEDNPYINPPKMPAPDNSRASEPAAVPSVGTIANTTSGFITLEKIVVVDANGNVIEKYDKLNVQKDIERNSNNPDNQTNQRCFTPYAAAVHLERKGLFLPSFALSCNILAVLYANRNDADVQKVLMQYKDYGPGHGWHAQNTLVNWSAKQVIHYPNKADYTSDGGTTDINTQKTRKSLNFDRLGFVNTTLEEALKKINYRKFMQDLTGLAHPEILVEIGSYFGTAKSWISTIGGRRMAWLGCLSDFCLDTGYFLVNSGVARGVRLAAAGGATSKKR